MSARTPEEKRLISAAVSERERGRCAYCRRVLASAEADYDHLIPKSEGGERTLANLALACRRCNVARGNRLLVDWLELIGLEARDPDQAAALRERYAVALAEFKTGYPRVE